LVEKVHAVVLAAYDLTLSLLLDDVLVDST
jgi:hypothetical protein